MIQYNFTALVAKMVTNQCDLQNTQEAQLVILRRLFGLYMLLWLFLACWTLQLIAVHFCVHAHMAQNIAERCQEYFLYFIAIKILSQHFCGYVGGEHIGVHFDRRTFSIRKHPPVLNYSRTGTHTWDIWKSLAINIRNCFYCFIFAIQWLNCLIALKYCWNSQLIQPGTLVCTLKSNFKYYVYSKA